MRYISLVLLFGISMSMSSQTMLPVKKNGKYGYIDADGNVIIEPQFTFASYFKNQRAVVVRNDSAYLLYQTNIKLLFPNIRNVREFQNGAFAFQDFSGLWAISDSTLMNKTPYEFNQIMEYFNCLVAKKNNWHFFYNIDLSRALKDSFQRVNWMDNYNIRCGNKDSVSIYHYLNDSLKFVMSGEQIFFRNGCYFVKSKTDKKKVKVYSIHGKFLEEGYNCVSTIHFAPYVTVCVDNSVGLYNENTGEKISSRFGCNRYILMRTYRDYILDSTDCIMYFKDFVIDLKSLGFQTCYFLDSNYLVAINDSLAALVNMKNEVLYTHQSMAMFKISEDLMMSLGHTEFEYYSFKLNKVILKTPVDHQASFDESSLMISKPNSTVIYTIDENYQFTDSGVFNNVAYLNAGSRTNYFPDEENLGANVAARNTSVNRYFYDQDRRKFGLLGFNNDTLLKAFLYSVIKVNDSIDLVTIHQSRMKNLFTLRNRAVSFLEFKYGLLNNRIGKFILKPNYYYLEKDDLIDSTTDVVRAILIGGKFALMNKATFEIEKQSICDYMYAESGHIYVGYDIKKILSSNPKETESELRKFWIPNFNYFNTSSEWRYPIRLEGSVSLFNSKAERLLDSSTLSKVKSLSRLKHGNFIFLDHNDQQGVLNLDSGIIVEPKYRNVEPLAGKDSFYVLSSSNPRFGYLNSNGEVLTEAKYNKAENFKNGYAWCTIRDSIQLIDSVGNEVGLEYRNFQKKSVSEGITAVRYRKGWQYVDLNGNALNEKLYKSVGSFINGYAAVRSRKGWGIIDENDQFVLEPKYDKFYAENENSIVFLHNEKYLFFSRDGVFKNKLKSKGKLVVLNNDLYKMENSTFSYVLDNNGEKYIKRKMSMDVMVVNDTLYSIKSKRIFVYKGKKRLKSMPHKGGIRAVERQKFEPQRVKKGHEYLEYKIYPCFHWLYPEIVSDSTNKLKIKVVEGSSKWVKIVNKNMVSCLKLNAFVGQKVSDNHYVLIDSLGNLIIDKSFLSLEYMGMDLFKASYFNDYGKQVMGVINKYGIWVLPPRFEDIRNFSEGRAIYMNSTGYHIADVHGNLISEELMTDIELVEQFFLLKSDNKLAWWHPNKGFITQFD